MVCMYATVRYGTKLHWRPAPAKASATSLRRGAGGSCPTARMLAHRPHCAAAARCLLHARAVGQCRRLANAQKRPEHSSRTRAPAPACQPAQRSVRHCPRVRPMFAAQPAADPLPSQATTTTHRPTPRGTAAQAVQAVVAADEGGRACCWAPGPPPTRPRPTARPCCQPAAGACTRIACMGE